MINYSLTISTSTKLSFSFELNFSMIWCIVSIVRSVPLSRLYLENNVVLECYHSSKFISWRDLVEMYLSTNSSRFVGIALSPFLFSLEQRGSNNFTGMSFSFSIFIHVSCCLAFSYSYFFFNHNIHNTT